MKKGRKTVKERLLSLILGPRKRSLDIQRIRATASPGDRVGVIVEDVVRSATVTNVRSYAYGPRELCLQGDDYRIKGWYSVELIVETPEEDGQKLGVMP